MHRSFTLLIFLAALLLLTGITPARAQTNQTKLIVSATAGYGDTGAYMLGDWMPVRVTLANPAGGDSRHVTVRVDSGSAAQNNLGHYQQEIDLPAQSRKEITLYSYSSNYGHQFSVQLFENGAEIETAVATADPYEPPSNMIVAVASSDSSLLNSIKGEALGHTVAPLVSGSGYYSSPGSGYSSATGASQTTVAHIMLADIPTLSGALDSLGALVIDDVDSSVLSSEQVSSIEGWVARGGMLLVTYRPGGADTLAGLDKLVPVTVSGSHTLSSLSSLSDLVSVSLTTTGSIAVGNAQLKLDPIFAASTRVLALQDGVPLVAVRDVGQGQVVYMGISPGLAPLKAWDGLMPLEKRIFAEHEGRLSYGEMLRFSPFSQSYGYYGSSIFSTSGGMFDLPGLQLPNAWLIGGFLLLYIIIVGPLNFFVLRRMRRTELAWFTIPGFVVLFSVFAYFLAVGSKGGDLVSIKVNVINSTEGVDVATVQQNLGVFSPLRSTYRLTLDASSSVTELNPYGFYQSSNSNPSPVYAGSNTTTIDNVNVDTYGLRAFLAEHTSVATSPLQADFHLGANKITGKVKNISNGPLQDVALVRGGAIQYIGYMAPGDDANVTLTMQNQLFNTNMLGSVLPLPAGVTNPQTNYVYYGSGGPTNSAAQREYNRKVNALSSALYPLLNDQAPDDLRVIMLAWGPAPSTQFGIDGQGGQTLEDNVWASTAHVVSTASDQPILDSSLVPYSIYAPGNSPSLISVAASMSSGSQGTPPGSVPQYPLPVPTDTPSNAVPPPVPTYLVGTSLAAMSFAPYADFWYRLPAGVQPQSLHIAYSINRNVSSPTLPVLDLSAYNVRTDEWDKIATMGEAAPSLDQDIPNPAQYVGSAGDVTMRLGTVDGSTVSINGSFLLSLNSSK